MLRIIKDSVFGQMSRWYKWWTEKAILCFAVTKAVMLIEEKSSLQKSMWEHWSVYNEMKQFFDASTTCLSVVTVCLHYIRDCCEYKAKVMAYC